MKILFLALLCLACFCCTKSDPKKAVLDKVIEVAFSKSKEIQNMIGTLPKEVKIGFALAETAWTLYKLWDYHNQELKQQFDESQQTMREHKLETFDDLLKHDRQKAEAFVFLAKQISPFNFTGINIGFFGQTSVGKSTIINSIIGKEMAATGYGETTMEAQPYESENGYTLWDMPGKNDAVSYLDPDYIAYWKGLSQRVIVMERSVKEMISITQLLDQIDLDYDIIVNKLNHVPMDQRQTFKKQIRMEASKYLKNGSEKRIWFINGKDGQIVDQVWLKMTNSLRDKRKTNKRTEL